MRSLLFFFLLSSSLLKSQTGLYLDVTAGFSNYQGDLQDKYFTTEQARAAGGIGIRGEVTDKLAFRLNFIVAGIKAADSYQKKQILQDRNLSFRSTITELNVLADYTFLNLNDYGLSPYLFAGVAVFHFNPYTFDSVGSKFFLKPLSTEGQGLNAYPNIKNYALTQISLPFGAGVRWRIANNMLLSYEIGLRKTFTDYLDDVSTVYVDPLLLATERGDKAVELAFRGNQKNNVAYPPAGTIRGGSKFKDWYYVSGLTLSIAINKVSSSAIGWGGRRSNTKCPKKVL
jgi:hypothetical protein